MGTELVQETCHNYTYFEDLSIGVIISDAEGNIVYSNSFIEIILGYSSDEIIGNGWWRIFSTRPNDIYDRRTVIVSMTNSSQDLKKHGLRERQMVTKQGKAIWTKWTYTRLPDGGLMRTVEDITQLKLLEEELEQTRLQNTVLRQEVHHRVKNNMQIVISLLNLQFRRIADKEALNALQRSKDRMISISLIHDYLCLTENRSFSCFGEYLEQLLGYIHENYCYNRDIHWKTRFSGHFSDYNNMVSLGLIVSELVINAYQHAFDHTTQDGCVTVELRCEEHGEVQIAVSDNGKGIEQVPDLKNPETLGYEIIMILVHQIEGRINLQAQKGTKAFISYYPD